MRTLLSTGMGAVSGGGARRVVSCAASRTGRMAGSATIRAASEAVARHERAGDMATGVVIAARRRPACGSFVVNTFGVHVRVAGRQIAHDDPHGVATHLAVLDVVLRGAAARIERQRVALTAVRTGYAALHVRRAGIGREVVRVVSRRHDGKLATGGKRGSPWGSPMGCPCLV